jgi:hypothetical protein
VSIVHQIGQEEGPPTLGGSCTYDPKGLMNGQVVVGFGNTLNKSKCKLDSSQVKVNGEKSPTLSSTLENVEDFMVLTTTFETTIAIEGDGFEGVGIINNPMCCVEKLVAVKRNETSKILEENDILIKSSIKNGKAKKYGRNNFVMDTIVDGPLLLGNRTHKVVNDASDRVFNYCC